LLAKAAGAAAVVDCGMRAAIAASEPPIAAAWLAPPYGVATLTLLPTPAAPAAAMGTREAKPGAAGVVAGTAAPPAAAAAAAAPASVVWRMIHGWSLTRESGMR
jgi:hypothetical protein